METLEGDTKREVGSLLWKPLVSRLLSYSHRFSWVCFLKTVMQSKVLVEAAMKTSILSYFGHLVCFVKRLYKSHSKSCLTAFAVRYEWA